MKQKIIRCLSLVCLIGMIISVQCPTVAADEHCNGYLPDADVNYTGPNDIEQYGAHKKWFYAGKYQRWIWAGTTTYLIVNDFDKEILIIDGYGSKATLTGANKEYRTAYHVTRLTEFANVLRGFAERDYKVVGIIVAHNHGDHILDLGTLHVLLYAQEEFQLEYNDNASAVLIEGNPVPDTFLADCKVISDWHTVDDPKCAKGFPCKEYFTHKLIWKNRYNEEIDMASQLYHFSNKANLYTIDGELVESEYAFEDEASLKLGHFAIQTVNWTHSNTIIQTIPRTIALNIWHSEAPEARRVFITTSAGRSGVEGDYYTDYLIYAWARSITSDWGRRDIARLAKRNFEFIDRGGEAGYIFATHHDRNRADWEMDEAEYLEESYDIYLLGEDTDDGLIDVLVEVDAVIDCPEDWTNFCWHGGNSGVQRRIIFGGYKYWVLGMHNDWMVDPPTPAWWPRDYNNTKVDITFDSDCDEVPGNEDNCPDVANPDQDDFDEDDMGDVCDLDDDNDSVDDEYDVDSFNQYICQDVDADSCDDCSVAGNPQVDNDGTDTDSDGLCDTGDSDDDNDNTSDIDEAACGSDPLNNESICEICDGIDNDLNDGIDEGFTDTDSDGEADCVDADDDNDTVADEADTAPLDQYVCQDIDADYCDDCSVAGNPQVSNDGTDTDSDGLCDIGDPDDDNDGLTDVQEAEIGTDPLNPDTDGDTVGDASDGCPLEDATGLDADGNGCIDSITGLPDVLDNLVEGEFVNALIANALLTRVASAQASLTRDNICTAINQIGAFQNQVNGQSGHNISGQAATLLNEYTNNIITQFLEGLPEGESCN